MYGHTLGLGGESNRSLPPANESQRSTCFMRFPIHYTAQDSLLRMQKSFMLVENKTWDDSQTYQIGIFQTTDGGKIYEHG